MCDECSELKRLIAVAVNKYEHMRAASIQALRSLDAEEVRVWQREVELSATELDTLAIKLLKHEHSHSETVPRPMTREAGGV
jgi:hypothetical protein